ncbi:hypothetical protein ACWC9U_31515 [Streptomyces sp. 900116325]
MNWLPVLRSWTVVPQRRPNALITVCESRCPPSPWCSSAKLTGLPAGKLRDDEVANIRGGAALLATYAKATTGRTPVDPGQWYAAVARYGGSEQERAAKAFADRVFATVKKGVGETTRDGQQIRLDAVADVRPSTSQLAGLRLKATAAAETECPPTLDCTFVPAASAKLRCPTGLPTTSGSIPSSFMTPSRPTNRPSTVSRRPAAVQRTT